MWMLFAYEDCFRLLRDPGMSVDPLVADAVDPGRINRFDEFRKAHPELPEPTPNRGILNIDPPDHTRIRKLMSKVFTPKRVEGLRPEVQGLVDGMLDAVADDGQMDVIADLAFPLPFVVISEMLGMPDADRDLLRDWSHTVVKMLDPILTDDEMLEAIAADGHMVDHCREAIEWKRANPGDDLLTALIHAEDDGQSLTAEELLDQVILLFIAGHETTVNLIGNATLALLRNPDQLELLRDRPLARRQRRRRAAALRQPGAVLAPHRAAALRGRRHGHRAGHVPHDLPRFGQPRPRGVRRRRRRARPAPDRTRPAT